MKRTHVHAHEQAGATGWRCKRTKIDSSQQTSCAPTPRICAIVENPAHGKLWRMPWFEGLAQKADWSLMFSSYCKYGLAHKKDTGILTNVKGVRLAPQCSAGTPCAALRKTGKHAAGVQGSNQQVRNSLPKGLVDALLSSFVAQQRAAGCCRFLVIDVFSGWGSVDAAARDFGCSLCTQDPTLRFAVFSNDIATRRFSHQPDVDFDMSHFNLRQLLLMALFAREQALDLRAAQRERDFQGSMQERVARHGDLAVLFHCSFPCTTYSTAGGSTHRDGGSIEAKTLLAKEHDLMGFSMVGDIEALCNHCQCSSASSSSSGSDSL